MLCFVYVCVVVFVYRCDKWWYLKKWARLIFHCIHSNQSTLKRYSDGKGINKSKISLHTIPTQEKNNNNNLQKQSLLCLFCLLSRLCHVIQSISSLNAPIKNKQKKIPFRQLFAFISDVIFLFLFWLLIFSSSFLFNFK